MAARGSILGGIGHAILTLLYAALLDASVNVMGASIQGAFCEPVHAWHGVNEVFYRKPRSGALSIHNRGRCRIRMRQGHGSTRAVRRPWHGGGVRGVVTIYDVENNASIRRPVDDSGAYTARLFHDLSRAPEQPSNGPMRE